MDLVIGIVVWLVFGLIIGAIAKAIMPGADGSGFGLTALLGVVGAIIGGFLGKLLNIGGDITSFSFSSPAFWVSVVLSVIGAILVLAVYRLVIGRSLKG